MFYDAVPVEHELISSVSLNTVKMRGSLVIAQEKYISVGGPKHFILVMHFLSLSLQIRICSLLLSRNRPHPSLSK